MILRTISEDGRFLVTKSDSGFMIRKTNPDNPREELYVDAKDNHPTAYEYEETDIPICNEEINEAL